jgi:tRNA (guanine37-N1)-methyltransferase
MRSIDVFSLFPDAVEGVLNSSILRRAQMKQKIALNAVDMRSFAQDKHKSVDAHPFGGQQGMLFKSDVLESAVQSSVDSVQGHRENLKIVYPSPRGAMLNQELLWTMSRWLLKETNPENQPKKIVFMCGRYEGVDERWVEKHVDLEFSLGDFILSGGELAALSALDGIVRLIPGVLGDDRSNVDESFHAGLLEYPQYTRPRELNGQKVPEALLSGHHEKIKRWKLRESLLVTAAFRPDLIEAHNGEGLDSWAQDLLERLKKRCQTAE